MATEICVAILGESRPCGKERVFGAATHCPTGGRGGDAFVPGGGWKCDQRILEISEGHAARRINQEPIPGIAEAAAERAAPIVFQLIGHATEAAIIAFDVCPFDIGNDAIDEATDLPIVTGVSAKEGAARLVVGLRYGAETHVERIRHGAPGAAALRADKKAAPLYGTATIGADFTGMSAAEAACAKPKLAATASKLKILERIALPPKQQIL